MRNDSNLCHTKDESYSAVNSNGRKFLNNSKGLDVSSLLVKEYVPLAHINKVIKLLKFKSAVNLQCFQWEAQSREIQLRNLIRSAHSISHLKHSKFTADLNFKSLITLLICAKGKNYFTSKLLTSRPLELYKNFLPFKLAAELLSW